MRKNNKSTAALHTLLEADKEITVNMLEIPENVPVHFDLTADAPMNSFWVPQLGGQIMVMPGMQTQLNLMATGLGSFNGFSANISGDGHIGLPAGTGDRTAVA